MKRTGGGRLLGCDLAACIGCLPCGIISTKSSGLSAACIGCRGEYMERYYLEQPAENVKAHAAKRGENNQKCKIRILKSDVLTSVIALWLVPIMNIMFSCTNVRK